MNKLITFITTLGQLAPTVQPLGIKTDVLINKIAVSLNLDVSDMFYTEEEKQMMEQEAQTGELIKSIAPNIASNALQNVEKENE